MPCLLHQTPLCVTLEIDRRHFDFMRAEVQVVDKHLWELKEDSVFCVHC